MKVEKLYAICKNLMKNNHGLYDVVVKLDGNKEEIAIMNDAQVESYFSEELGLLVLVPLKELDRK